jgi:pSer/pThr/pTyr-binding forkhead associated (FHA) protein
MNISEVIGGTGSWPIPGDRGLASTMKSFLNACGFREALRITIAGPRAGDGESRGLPQPFAVIGRDARADVILDDPRVSRRHVYIQAVAGQVFWLDLESRTGTCDETGTRKSGWLAGGGLLEIGPFVIRRVGDGASAGAPGPREPGRESPLAVRAYGREPLPEVTLEFLNGPSQSTVWPMNRVMSLVGSAKGCKFRLTDPSVSMFHAGLLRTPTGLWVVDLRGGRSISINSEPVRFGPLSDGDVLGIGRYRIRLRCREPRAGAHDPDREVSSGLPARQERGEVARRPARGRSGIAASAPPAFTGSFLPMPPAPMPPVPMPFVASASNVELVSSDAVVPGRFQPEVTESVLVPLVNQFSMMQQQMFDQFQQAMGMLVQMFGRMHSEQMEVIREELDRLHDLTRELQDLKDELAKSSGRPSPSPAEPAAAPVTPPMSAGSAMPAAEVIADRRPGEVPAAWAGQPAGAAPAATEVPGPWPKAGAPGPRRPLVPVTAPPLPTTGPRPDQPRPGVGSPGTIDTPGPAGTEQDTVAWIHQRIMTIQHERETRWQKILKLLPGVS